MRPTKSIPAFSNLKKPDRTETAVSGDEEEENGWGYSDDNYREKHRRHEVDTSKGTPHTQERARAQLALTVIEDALTAIEKDRDEESLRWVRNPDTGALSLTQACRACNQSVEAVQEEARSRLETYEAAGDPIEHDEVDSLDVLEEHPRHWITKSEARDRFGVTMSQIQYRIEAGRLESVRAPKARDNALPVRYVLAAEIEEVFG
jgi:hypothetical protein